MRPFFVFICVMLFTLRGAAQFDSTLNLSNTDKLYGLSLFWKEAAYNFAYFDKANINWDSAYQAFIPQVLNTKNTYEYYRVMEQFCALLKDGHTNVYPPSQTWTKGSTNRQIALAYLENKVILTNIAKRDSALVPLGSEVISVNDIPTNEYLQKEMIPYIAASAKHQLYNDAARRIGNAPDTNTITRLTFKTPAGKTISYNARLTGANLPWTYKFAGTGKPSKFYMETMPGGIVYMQLNTFGDDAVVKEFRKNLPAIYNAKGIIIDLRYNGGGNTDVGVNILKYFTDKPLIRSAVWRTRDNLSAYRAWGMLLTPEYLKDPKLTQEEREWMIKSMSVARGEYWYHGTDSGYENRQDTPRIKVPLVVLTGNNTASAAEDFLVCLDDVKGRATTVGERSYGSTGQPLSFKLPGGGSARICTKRDTYPDGREFVGYGVKPDIEVNRRIADLWTGKDAVMEKGLEVLKSKMK